MEVCAAYSHSDTDGYGVLSPMSFPLSQALPLASQTQKRSVSSPVENSYEIRGNFVLEMPISLCYTLFDLILLMSGNCLHCGD